MIQSFITLAMRTVSEPRVVAAELVAMRIERRTLWSALVLAVVLNALVYQLTLVISPPPAGALPQMLSSPLVFALLVGAGLVLSIFSITYAGRVLGGTGRLDDIMTVLIWLQYLRFAVQLLALILMPVIPSMASILVLIASLYGMWLVLNFVDVGHGFGNLFTSFGVLVMSALGIMLGLAILLTLLGLQNMGLTPYV